MRLIASAVPGVRRVVPLTCLGWGLYGRPGAVRVAVGQVLVGRLCRSGRGFVLAAWPISLRDPHVRDGGLLGLGLGGASLGILGGPGPSSSDHRGRDGCLRAREGTCGDGQTWHPGP